MTDTLLAQLSDPARYRGATRVLIANNDAERIASLLEGVALGDETHWHLQIGGDLQRLPEAHREWVVLALMRHLGRLDAATSLSTGRGEYTDLSVLSGLPALSELVLFRLPRLRDFSALRALPALERLIVEDCPAVRSLAGLAQHPRLRHLDLFGCPDVADFSALLEMPGLEALELSAVRGAVPAVVAPGLKRLCVVGDCASLAGVRALVGLETLELSYNDTLSSLDDLPPLPALRHLRLDSAVALESLSALAGAPLETLALQECSGSVLETLPALPKLRRLELCEFDEDALDLRPLARLPALAELHLSVVHGANDLRPLLPVEGLVISGDPRLVQLWADQRAASALLAGRTDQQRELQQQLHHLLGEDDEALIGQGLELLRSLEDAAVLAAFSAGCSVNGHGRVLVGEAIRSVVPARWQVRVAVEVLRQQGRLQDVEVLDLQQGDMADLPLSVFAGMTRLEELWVPHGTTDLSALAGLTALKRLRLSGVRADPGVIRQLSGLQRLWMDGCRQPLPEDLFVGCPALEALDISQNEDTDGLELLRPLSALRELILLNDDHVNDLRGLRHVPRLQRLQLAGGEYLEDIAPIAHLTQLSYLAVGWNNYLSDLSPLAGLTQLCTLDLERTTNLSDLSPLASLQAMSFLNLKGCSAVVDLSPLAGLARLSTLDLSGTAADLSTLPPLPGLQRLRVGAAHAEQLGALAGRRSLIVQGGEAVITRWAALQGR